MGETGQFLQRIAAQVAGITEAVSGIAASATEQAAGLADINTAVNQMDQVTQQNAAMVEQSTAAVVSLAEETEQLTVLTGRFKTTEAEFIKPAAFMAPRDSAKPKTRLSPATALKTVSVGHGGGAARKPAAQPAEANWQEF